MKHYIYITLMTIVFVAFTVVFDTFPRSTVSELERRELAVFPEYTSENFVTARSHVKYHRGSATVSLSVTTLWH